MVSIVAVVAVTFSTAQNMAHVMDVIIPLRVIENCAAVAITFQIAGGVVIVLQNSMDLPLASNCLAYGCGQLAENVWSGIVLDGMHGVKTQPIEMELFQPVEGVVNEEVTYDPAVFSIEVDAISPGCAMTVGKKLRRVCAQIISFRAEVVVDHIKQHHQTFVVGRLNQVLKIFRAAIGRIRSIRKNAVISPIPFSEEVRHGH